MYNVSNSVYNWFANAANSAGSSASAAGTDFSKFLEGVGGKSGGSDSAGSLLEYLSRKFPNANFSEGSVGETPKDVEEYFGKDEGDNVAVEAAAAEAIAGNPGLSKIFEDMMAAFQNTAGQTQAMDGAYLQRNVVVTVVTVRFSVSQIDGESGETLSMNELTTAFSEKLRELAQKFFGNVSETETEDDETGSDAIDIVAKEPQDAADATNPYASFFGAGFSFSMYFSAGYIKKASESGEDGTGGDFFGQNFQASFAARGNFQSYANSTFSNAVFSGLMSSGLGSGAFTSMLDKGMDMLGMSTESSWMRDGGFFAKFGQSRGLIAELMAMYSASSGSLSVAAADAAEPKAAEPTAGADAPAETPEPAAVQ